MASPPVRSILAATDLGPRSGAVLREAAALARVLDADLHALHVVEAEPPEKAGSSGEADAPGRLAAAREQLAAEVERNTGGVLPASQEVRTGKAHEAIRSRAEQTGADLVVLGPNRHRDLEARVLGTTAERVIRDAEVPCLVVRVSGSGEGIAGAAAAAAGSRPDGTTRVLAAVDDSPHTGEVLRWAAALADGLGARLTVSHVFHPTYKGVSRIVSGGDARRRLEPEQREQARKWLEDEARAAGLPADDVALQIREGNPGEVILEEERRLGPDLLVMGSRGAGAVEKALLGSVASVVLRRASVPVLVVPGRGTP